MPDQRVLLRGGWKNKAGGSREGGRQPSRALQSLKILSYEQLETVDMFQEHADMI